MLLVPLRRVSDGEQVDGSGLQRQSDQALAYAEARGWHLHTETYSDEGVSGFSGANLDGDLGRFLSDLKRGHFGDQPVALGVEDLDRLSRQFSLAFLPVLVDDLLNAGVTLAVMKKGRDISRESVRKNQMELHELLFWMGGAHEFSLKLSDRITDHRDRLRQAIRDGKPTNPGKAPSWISLEKDQWVLNDYADVIRRIIEMSQAGFGAPTIAKKLNADRVPSPGTILKRRTNPKAPISKWAPTVVLQILHSPALHGARSVAVPGHNTRIRKWKEKCAHKLRQGDPPEKLPRKPEREFEPEQQDYYPALLTLDEHEALKSLLSSRLTSGARGRSDKNYWIASRLTTCSCGSTLTTYSKTTKRGKGIYRYLRCTGKRDGASACDVGLIPLLPAQAHLLTRLTSSNFLEVLRRQTGENVQGQLSQFTSRRQELISTVEATKGKVAAGETVMAEADDPAVLSILAKRQAALQQELMESYSALDSVERELQSLQATGSREQMAADASEAVKGLLGRFASGADDVDDRRAVNDHLQRLGMRVVIDGDRMGLSIGDHEPEWQVMNPRLDLTGLRDAMTDAKDLWFNVDAEAMELMKQLPRSEDGLADMRPLFEAMGLDAGDQPVWMDLSPRSEP